MTDKPTDKLAKKPALAVAEENLLLVRGTMVSLSETIGKLAKPDSLGRCLVELKQLESAIQDIRGGVEDKVKTILLEQGEQTTEKGSRALTVNGITVTMRPTRTGIDSKKLERLLRIKGLKLTDYMDEQVTVTYKVNMSKVEMSTVAGKLTDDELEQCKYDESWSLQPVRREDV